MSSIYLLDACCCCWRVIVNQEKPDLGGKWQGGREVVNNDHEHCVLIQQVGVLAAMTYDLLLGLFCTLSGLTSTSPSNLLVASSKKMIDHII